MSPQKPRQFRMGGHDTAVAICAVLELPPLTRTPVISPLAARVGCCITKVQLAPVVIVRGVMPFLTVFVPHLRWQHDVIMVEVDSFLRAKPCVVHDPGLCVQAGIPDDTKFATKPQLAQQMIERAIAAGLPFGWFTADEAYGDNGPLRDWLEEQQVAYAVAVSCDHRVPAGAGQTIRADRLAAKVPARGWHRMSCGPGSKGERLYDWALAAAGQCRHLLIRRSLTSGELACYWCWCPAP
jgi:hypothetical protein